MDYKIKYKEALEGIRELYNSDCDMIRVKRLRRRFEHIFPELKESEDDRIRKMLHAYIHDFGVPKEYFEDIEISDVLAWLEKQGKLKEENKKEDIVARYPCAGDPILCNPKRDGNILIYTGTKLDEEYRLSDLKTEKD